MTYDYWYLSDVIVAARYTQKGKATVLFLVHDIKWTVGLKVTKGVLDL